MPHEIVPVQDDELGKLLQKTFALPIRKRYIKVDGVVLPEHFKHFAERIENFNIRDDDVWVCSFPKTGTTWTQEMAWTILYDVDSEAAKVPLTDRVPYFEISQFLDYTEETPPTDIIEFPEYAIDSVDFVDKFPSPRIIKSHLPLHLLPRQLRNGETKAKIIYVNRNAKDTCISYYHHARLLEGYHGTFEELCTLFIGDTVHHGPFWAHVLAFWKKRNDENVLFLKFEDLKTNLSQEIDKTAKFLGKKLTTEQLSRLTTHLSFSNMRNNPAANNENLVALAQVVMPTDSKGKFMRVGDTKQWKAVMTPEFIEQFDNWTRKWLKDSDYDSK